MKKTIKLPPEVIDKFKSKHDNVSKAIRELVRKEQLHENSLHISR